MKLLTIFLLLAFSLTSIAADGSATCEYIQRSKNAPDKSINIVLVPSGFGDDVEKFESTVRELWKEVADYQPYSENVKTLSVIIAKIPGTEEGFCRFGNKNERILDCDFLRAAHLAKRCHDGDNRYYITIHNSTRHGGSGQRFGASATIARNSAEIIAHELGHSIFKLADEYEYDGSKSGKNCTSNSSCDSWKDLIDAGLATCEPGCENKSRFTSPGTLMGSLSQKSFGHVNRRLICCEYKKQTGEYPSFCDTYKNVGDGLDNYCR